MLPSKKRLNRSVFEELSKNRNLNTVFNRFGTLKYVENKEDFAFSVVLSSKKEKSAVKRNKLKRRIYSILSLFYKENNNFNKIKGIIYLSKDAYNMSFDDLKKYLYELLKKNK